MHGAALVLTVLLIAALKKGGKTIPAIGGLVAGALLAYFYSHSGDPWTILHNQADRIRGNLGDELGAAPAALGLAIIAWWQYAQPKVKMSTLYGFMLMVCAQAADGLWTRAVSIIGSLARVVTG